MTRYLYPLAALDLRNGETLFVEARFTRIQTTQPTDFVPIRVGLRF